MSNDWTTACRLLKFSWRGYRTMSKKSFPFKSLDKKQAYFVFLKKKKTCCSRRTVPASPHLSPRWFGQEVTWLYLASSSSSSHAFRTFCREACTQKWRQTRARQAPGTSFGPLLLAQRVTISSQWDEEQHRLQWARLQFRGSAWNGTMRLASRPTQARPCHGGYQPKCCRKIPFKLFGFYT